MSPKLLITRLIILIYKHHNINYFNILLDKINIIAYINKYN